LRLIQISTQKANFVSVTYFKPYEVSPQHCKAGIFNSNNGTHEPLFTSRKPHCTPRKLRECS